MQEYSPASAPPDNTSSATDSEPRLRGLRLPVPGNRYAIGFGWAGPAFYLIFNGLMISALVAHNQSTWGETIRELVGLKAEEQNYPLFLLITLGLLIFAAACVSVVNDARQLAGEEEDVDWVNRTGRDGLGLVFAPAAKREALFRKGVRQATHETGAGVDTLMDDRVRRVLEKERNRFTLVSPDELRVIAETRTSRYGSVSRFASSLLLLLAVLGTFAGVKTALPGLIQAISSTDAEEQGTGNIVGPLQAVAGAFGGNALALVGAIAAGLMAQGLSMGRRNLLERLELVSSEYLYGGLQTGSMDPLTGAVNELRETAEHVRDASVSIAGVEAGMTGMGEAFREAFAQLKDRLTQIVEQQDQALHERTSKDIRELQRRIAEMAAIVEANTRAYSSIIDTVDLRARESRESIELVSRTSASLQQALQSVAHFQATAERAAAGVQDTLSALQTGGEVAAQRMEAAAASIERSHPAVAELEKLLLSFHGRIETLDGRAAEAWSSASKALTDRFGEALRDLHSADGQRGPVAHGAAGTAGNRDPELVALMRRVAVAVENGQPSSRVVLAHAGAILGAGAVIGLSYGIYRLASLLFGG
jgi:hypothetical protein